LTLATWNVPDWTRRLSTTTVVTVAGDEVDAAQPRLIYIAQTADAPAVRTPLAGKGTVLSHEEARALVQYLFDGGLLEYDANAEAVSIPDDDAREKKRLAAKAHRSRRRDRDGAARKKAWR